jgi:hypothetical protein
MYEDIIEENVNTNTNSRIIREAIKASSNLLATNDALSASKLSGALSLLAIASSINEDRYIIRLLNVATNIIQKSI